MVHLKDSNRYVCDPDMILSPSVRDSMDFLLHRLEQTKGVQTVVAVARRIAGGEAYDWGMALARQHGVGSKKQNSGLLIVLATDDRAYYVLTGTGLEGALPDAVCRRIENRYMLPAFKQGDWNRGLLLGVTAICSYIEKDSALMPEAHAAQQDDSPIVALFIVLAMLLVFWLVFRNSKRAQGSRCPACGHNTLRPTGESIRLSPTGRRKYIWRCSHCGHSEARDDDHFDSTGAAGLLPWLLLFGPRGGGSGFGGGLGSGGFGGGSFGGGSFGGGGAGGHF